MLGDLLRTVQLRPGVTTHLPITLLFVGVGLNFFASKGPNLRWSDWLLLVIGALANTLTGLVAHLAYTRTALFVVLAVALLAARFRRGWHPSVPGTGLTGSSHPRCYGFTRRKPSM